MKNIGLCIFICLIILVMILLFLVYLNIKSWVMIYDTVNKDLHNKGYESMEYGYISTYLSKTRYYVEVEAININTGHKQKFKYLTEKKDDKIILKEINE